MDTEFALTFVGDVGLGMAIFGVALCLWKFGQDLYKEAFKKGEK